jgi:hypothetical protein
LKEELEKRVTLCIGDGSCETSADASELLGEGRVMRDSSPSGCSALKLPESTQKLSGEVAEHREGIEKMASSEGMESNPDDLGGEPILP